MEIFLASNFRIINCEVYEIKIALKILLEDILQNKNNYFTT